MATDDQFSVNLDAEREAAKVCYQSLRTELVERVKLRDQLLIAYLGAVTALIGFALEPKREVNLLLPALLVLVPVLSLGATATICHHQEIMSVFTEYIANELNQWMSKFPIYDGSLERKKFGGRAEFHILLSQIPLLCGPWALVWLLNWPYNYIHFGRKEVLSLFGFILDVYCAIRLVSARNFRRKVWKDIFFRSSKDEQPADSN